MLGRQLLSTAARRSAQYVAPRARTVSPLLQRCFSASADASRRHVIAALVVNQPGCLAQIANLFAARGYNIDSLVVGRTEVDELSRMTVVVNANDQSVINMKKQLEDVVHVAVVNILTRGHGVESNLVERDLMLAKISTTRPGARQEVVELASLFDAKVIDVREDQVMLQVAGAPGRIEALLTMLTPIGVTEVHRTGVIAMARRANVAEAVGELTLEDATERIMQDADDEVDLSRLPPG